ncbi:hypothetical protein [Streptomyces griseorubiginosus]|uniref:hypothetical protein n=1 Tax=Streptomyces griseorubiginosus TaxID=67304 RepID=UPI002E813052|nr:hypothetical protein [Streptomyces griseorubiginosus]WUB41908.1 hypothetical protein OHN19_00655 [Streptomyces griseorubiginosus]WUB50428.1 hypothetical protein OG942_00650 [Streptomyces griseorubiginosus]
MKKRTYRYAVTRVVAAVLGVLAVLTSMLVSASTAQAAPLPLPGGKANWVVSVGGLASGKDPGNWVRLGYYVFDPDDGTVTTNYWSWSEGAQPKRVNTVKADCDGTVPHCYVRTVEGFTGDPTGGYRGRFEYDASGRLVVTWTADRYGNDILDLRETWNLETSLVAGGVARITSPTYYTNTGTDAKPGAEVPASGSFTSYDATFGIGYGSNYSLDSASRVNMSELANNSAYNTLQYKGTFVRVTGEQLGREWAGGNWTFSGQKGDNSANPWQKCDGAECLGFVQHGTSCSDDNDPDKDRARYIAEIGGGRRNTEEYWCMLLAGSGDCYAYNSHPRPMLQIIDDSGKFQGWVGAEVFTHVDTGTGQPDNVWSKYYTGIFDTVSPDLKPQIPSTWNGRQAVPGFSLSYGNSVATGDLAWKKDALQFGGRNFVVSGCRFVELVATGVDGTTRRGTSSPLCVGMESDGTRAFKGELGFAGGATSVLISYWVSEDSGDTYSTKGVLECTPQACVNSSRYPVTEFKVGYGNSVATGSLTWFNQSLSFEGTNHVASGCRFVELIATGADGSQKRATSSRFCASGGDLAFGPQKIDFSGVVGGATNVVVTYWVSDDGGLTYATKETDKCTRDGCATDIDARNRVTEFKVGYGNSLATGSLTWFNQSLSFEGTNHVASGCRFVELIATGADGSQKRATSSRFCASGGDLAFGPQKIDFSGVVGGATNVVVTYWVSDDGGLTYATKETDKCTRNGCA